VVGRRDVDVPPIMDIDSVFSHIDSSTQIPEVISLPISHIPLISWLIHLRSEDRSGDSRHRLAIEQLHSLAKGRMNRICSSQSMRTGRQFVPSIR